MPHLEIHKKNRKRVRYATLPDDGSAEIGRSSSCAVALHDYGVSRAHCVIERTNGGWRVRDLASKHGIRVNDLETDAAALGDGDAVRIGPYTLIFRRAPAPSREDRKKREQLADEASTLRLRVETLEHSLADRQAALHGREKEMERLQDRLAAAQAAEATAPPPNDVALASLQAELVAAHSTIESGQERAEEAESARDDLKTERDELQTRAQEAEAARDDLKREHDQLMARMEALDTAVGAADRAASDDSRRAAKQEHEFLSQIDALTTDLERERTASDAAETERIRLKDEVGLLKQETELQRNEASAAIADRETLRDELAAARAELETAGERNRNNDERIETLEHNLGEVREALAIAQKSADTARQNRDAMDEQLANSLHERDQARDRLVAVISDLDEARTRHQEVEKQLGELSAQRDDLQEQLKTLTAESGETRQKVCAAEEDLAEMRKALEQAECATQTAVEDRSSLAHKLEDTQRERDAARKEANEHEELAAALQNRLDEMPTDIDRAEIDELRTEHRERGALLQQMEREAAIAKQNQDEFKRRTAEIEQERSALLSRCRLTQSKFDGVRKELEEASARIRDFELILAQYVQGGRFSRDVDARIVEMTADEIARAKAEGATVVELDMPRR